VGVAADKKVRRVEAAAFFQYFYLGDKDLGVHDYAGAYYASLAAMKDARWKEVKDEFFAVYDDCMAGVITSLKTRYDGGLFGKYVYYLAFALVAPLSSYDYDIVRHGLHLYARSVVRMIEASSCVSRLCNSINRYDKCAFCALRTFHSLFAARRLRL